MKTLLVFWVLGFLAEEAMLTSEMAGQRQETITNRRAYYGRNYFENRRRLNPRRWDYDIESACPPSPGNQFRSRMKPIPGKPCKMLCGNRTVDTPNLYPCHNGGSCRNGHCVPYLFPDDVACINYHVYSLNASSVSNSTLFDYTLDDCKIECQLYHDNVRSNRVIHREDGFVCAGNGGCMNGECYSLKHVRTYTWLLDECLYQREDTKWVKKHPDNPCMMICGTNVTHNLTLNRVSGSRCATRKVPDGVCRAGKCVTHLTLADNLCMLRNGHDAFGTLENEDRQKYRCRANCESSSNRTLSNPNPHLYERTECYKDKEHTVHCYNGYCGLVILAFSRCRYYTGKTPYRVEFEEDNACHVRCKYEDGDKLYWLKENTDCVMTYLVDGEREYASGTCQKSDRNQLLFCDRGRGKA